MSLTPLLIACLMIQAQRIEVFSGQPDHPISISSSPPLLIYFSSKKCTPCAPIDDLFQDAEVIKQIEKHYVTVQLSIDDQIGKACAEIYQVNEVPAIVVADYSGAILFKSEQQLSTNDIYDLISQIPKEDYTASTKDIEYTKNDPGASYSQTTEQLQTPAVKKESSDMHLQATVSDPNTSEITPEKHIKTETKEQLQHSTNINDVSPLIVKDVNVAMKEASLIPTKGTPVSDELSRGGYVNQVKKAQSTTSKSSTHPISKPRTYSIQLGYFTVEPNADALLQKAKTRGFSTAFTQTETHSGLTYFRVLVGKYSTLTDAQALLDQIHAAGLKGAVYRK